MPDYSKGKIYLLECDDLIYVGSTVETLETRLSKHKNTYNNWKYNNSAKCSSYKLFEKNKPINIILLLEYPCGSKRELEELEQHYINELDCVNINRAFLTREERIKENYAYKKSKRGREARRLNRLKNNHKYNEYQRNYRANRKQIKNID